MAKKKTLPRKRAKKQPVPPRKQRAGYSDAQLAAAEQVRQDFANRSPQPVLETLFPEGAEIGGRKVIPLSLSSYTFLERLENPITEPGGLEKMENIQLIELCYVLTRPMRELNESFEELWTQEDRSAWENMLLIYGAEIPAESLQMVGFVVGTVVAQATQTMVATKPKKKAGKPSTG